LKFFPTWGWKLLFGPQGKGSWQWDFLGSRVFQRETPKKRKLERTGPGTGRTFILGWGKTLKSLGKINQILGEGFGVGILLRVWINNSFGIRLPNPG